MLPSENHRVGALPDLSRETIRFTPGAYNICAKPAVTDWIFRPATKAGLPILESWPARLGPPWPGLRLRPTPLL